MTRLITALVVGLLSFVVAPSVHAMECGDVRMPNRITVDGVPLVLNGQGIREATVFNVDVYVAGLYLENRSRDDRQIIQSAQRKRLVLHLVRDVSREEMVDALRSGFRSNAGGDMAAIQDRVRRFERWIPELEEGDTLTFTYTPGEGLEVAVKGRVRGTIEGEDFARVFFSIWLGNSPPNAGLKRGLIGGGCD